MDYLGKSYRVYKGDTRGLDYSSHGVMVLGVLLEFSYLKQCHLYRSSDKASSKVRALRLTGIITYSICKRCPVMTISDLLPGQMKSLLLVAPILLSAYPPTPDMTPPQVQEVWQHCVGLRKRMSQAKTRNLKT